MCRAVYSFTQIALHADAHCSELSFWFKFSGFCYTMSTGPSPCFPVGILSYVHPSTMVPEDQSLHMLQHVIDGVDVGVGKLKALDLCLSCSQVMIRAYGEG